VYRGQWLGATVAIKVLKTHRNPMLKKQFKTEVNIMGSLRHPNII
jgi:serine/threonine protein kinase